jgi:hypothetical protein
VLLRAIDVVKTLIEASLKIGEAKVGIETGIINEMKQKYMQEPSVETKKVAMKKLKKWSNQDQK